MTNNKSSCIPTHHINDNEKIVRIIEDKLDLKVIGSSHSDGIKCSFSLNTLSSYRSIENKARQEPKECCSEIRAISGSKAEISLANDFLVSCWTHLEENDNILDLFNTDLGLVCT